MDMDIALIIDSDAQHDPNQIIRLIQPPLENKTDIINDFGLH